MKKYFVINPHVDAAIDAKGISGIVSPKDQNATQYIMEGDRYATVSLLYEAQGKQYTFSTLSAESEAYYEAQALDRYLLEFTYKAEGPLQVKIRYTLDGKALKQQILLSNTAEEPLEVQDLSTYFPSNTHFAWGDNVGEMVLNHSFIGGYSSYM